MTTADLAATVDRMERHAIAVRLAELGRQMAVAAGLQLAFDAGNHRGRIDAVLRGQNHHWRPGCGRSAP